MNFSVPAHATTRVALTGAAGAFGRTALLALRDHPTQRASILCDIDLDALRRQAESLGYAATDLVICSDAIAVKRVVEVGRIALVESSELLDPEAFDVLVEATGIVRVSVGAALAAIDSSRSVVLVSKETESLFGRLLAHRAAENGVVSTTGAGDQPANLVKLVQWAEALGMTIVAAGKSSEYDLVFDPESGDASVLDSSVNAPSLAELWELGDDIPATLAARTAAVAGLKLGAAADYCEMAVVANLTGLAVDVPEMHYPIARYSELADILASRNAGGILQRDGVLEVFTLLREPDEASFGGGEFIVVRCPDAAVASLLAQKGHVISRRGDQLCIGLPFHLMGLELPGTIAQAAAGVPVARPADRRLTMVALAEGQIASGSQLVVAGHHHEIAGTTPALLAESEVEDIVPYYLLDGSILRADVAAGVPIRFSDVDGIDAELLELHHLDRSLSIATPKEGVS